MFTKTIHFAHLGTLFIYVDNCVWPAGWPGAEGSAGWAGGRYPDHPDRPAAPDQQLTRPRPRIQVIEETSPSPPPPCPGKAIPLNGASVLPARLLALKNQSNDQDHIGNKIEADFIGA